jgi:UDP-glucose 4-epimerase
MGRRVLVTGLATFWGGRLAQALEDDPSVDVIIGLDTKEPTVRLERTEFVRTDESYSILARIVRATKVDTVLHTFLVVDPGAAEARRMHEINVIGTMNLCAAVSAPGSAVRTLVLKSFTGVYGSSKEDPTFFAEDTPRPNPPRHRSELSLTEVEQYVCDLGTDDPDIAVSVLRFANVLGPDITTTLTRLLELPAVPAVFGFDPRLQFVHEDDVVRALRFAMDHRLRGAYNVAGDGLLPWSEVIAMVGKRPLYLPPFATDVFAGAGRWVGIPPMPPEAVALLKFGRGVDTRKLRAAGFTYLFDTPGAIADHVGALRLRRTVGESTPDYRYDEDVEAFFRRSTAVLTAVADERH